MAGRAFVLQGNATQHQDRSGYHNALTLDMRHAHGNNDVAADRK